MEEMTSEEAIREDSNGTGALDGVRTLVVDDDARLRSILNTRLTRWGAKVSEARDGSDGLLEVDLADSQRRPFGLIFVDSRMRLMDGFELLERLGKRPEGLGAAILMLEPDQRGSELVRARNLGVSQCLVKPLERTRLRAAIAGALGKSPRILDDPELRPTRILVADDSPDCRILIQLFLGDPGFEIDTAEDGAAALDLYRVGDYDLVLMDIQMPNVDGYRAIDGIRSWDRKNGRCRTPIVAITAHAHLEDAQKSIRAGFDGYYTKPLRKEVLVNAVRRHVRRRAATALQ